MFSQIIQILLAGCIVSVGGSQETKRCLTKGTSDCFQYIVCTDDADHEIFPGIMKTLVQDVYIPRGLSINVSSNVLTSADKSVIISRVYVSSQDDSLSVSEGTFIPIVTESAGGRVRLSTEATFYFGDVNCNGTRKFVNVAADSTANPAVVSYPVNSSDPTTSSHNTTTDVIDTSTGSSYNTDHTTSFIITSADVVDNDSGSSNDSDVTTTILSEDPCSFCLLRLAVDCLMADISDVSDNVTRTVTTTFVFENVQVEVKSMLVLRLTHNSSSKSYFSTDIPDIVDFPLVDSKAFQLKTMFLSPLSSYKLVLKSSDLLMRIATVRIDAVGKHYESIIATTSGPGPDDFKYCSSGPDTRIIDFGYLPNPGAYDNKTSISASSIEFKVILTLNYKAISGMTFPLQINLEVDSVLSMTSTKYFNATERAIIEPRFINLKTANTGLLIPKSGSGSVVLTWVTPSLSSGRYTITTSTRRYSGTGGDGLIVSGIKYKGIGSNFLCTSKSYVSKMGTNVGMDTSNIPYSNKSTSHANTIGFKVFVISLANQVEAYSSHELTVTLGFVGQGPPQSFQFYFNFTNQEIFMTPDIRGNIPLKIYFYEKCKSITYSTDVVLILHTAFNGNYGRLFVELPSDSIEQPFVLCDFRISNGFNILQLYRTYITRRDDGMIEKVLVEFSPLSNAYLQHLDQTTVNYVSMHLTVAFTNKSLLIHNLPESFAARIITNNKTVWMEQIPIIKPTLVRMCYN